MPSIPPMIVKLRDSQGSTSELVLPGPEGIRFVVGEPGRHSAVWRMWGGKTVPDVYIAVKDIIEYQKWSLHPKGKWRHAWVKSAEALTRAAELGHEGDRAIQEWDPPDEIGDTGLRRGLEIRVRHQDLVDVDEAKDLKPDTIWLNPPPEGHEVRIGIFVARALQPGIIDVPGFTPFAGMSLPNGIAAVLIRETHAIEPRHGADLERAVNYILAAAQEKGTDLSARDVRLVIGFDHNPTGSKIVYDIAKPHTAPG
ncbi:hypothetical protein [Mycobacteroides abscessus]|nr:hypothetical protein [Mycobacteroides abscessus]SKV33945.1 Uncharacterised protein [Mycobacteroides abscessus subsp. massiliense]SHP14099.1 Uncharacterised protein [Mycobacteroides abscessus subsp. abscessus]SHS44414.1 Uncharacterised protein [Mycobacteroides abscessus subsp. abscessus]SHS77260.1 Uncharacterised protein [Mycobacteroides abscessus subsp. abscessus]SKD16725.1 Uncharacterised protein [Mycobacteroides abscessus subsp. abscessus]